MLFTTTYRLGFSLFVLFLSGCSAIFTVPTEPLKIDKQPTLSQCTELFRVFDRVVKRTRTGDAQSVPIDKFPYLRTDRFLASFADESLSENELTAWVNQLQKLGEQSNAIELANLPQSVKPIFPAYETLQQCGDLLRKHDFSDAQNQQKLLESINVPSEYQMWKRVLGLYWLSAWFIKIGVVNLHEEIMATYKTPLAKLPVKGQLISYVPPENFKPLKIEEIKVILQNSAKNPLSIPEPVGENRARLFETFAPIWQVDTLSNDDKIGAPTWLPATDKPTIDTTQVTVYTYLSHTWFEQKVLLQLNYVVWFPARPFTSTFDLLGGHLDGLTWRVTLSSDGTPLAYDSIHNCGCYHLFYPSSGVCIRPTDEVLQEPVFSPQSAPPFISGQTMHLRVAHTTHFIDRVFNQAFKQGKFITYHFADYETLRSLPVSDEQNRSLFQADGIVPGTQRAERFILWPMGIPNPGEMRQRGHHATAFFGKRHFDDANLMERSFEYCPHK